MKCELKCLSCHIEQIEKIGNLLNVSDKTKETIARSVLKNLSTIDFDQTNPEAMRDTWEIITEGMGEPNPYKEIKNYYNQELLKMYDELKENIKASDNPFFKALEVAALGNIIDFGANHEFNQSILFETLNSWESQDSPFVIDDSNQLFNQLSHAKTLLYIGDNCGEIVLDKLFIEEISKQFPHLNTVYSVRGKAVLNDITIEDAEQVKMMEVATVIDDGNGAPGAVLNQASKDFNQIFNDADVVIAKGQGNFESLSGVDKKELFFLFMAKCSVIADLLNIPSMKCVCMKNSNI